MTSAHLDLHEAHCLRFLVLCPECKEAIPKEKMEEHREKGHRQVSRWNETQSLGGPGGMRDESVVLTAGQVRNPPRSQLSDCEVEMAVLPFSLSTKSTPSFSISNPFPTGL